jgi:hypothetical protein
LARVVKRLSCAGGLVSRINEARYIAASVKWPIHAAIAVTG